MTDQTYTLNCTRCGKVYESEEAFPKPQLCGKCEMTEYLLTPAETQQLLIEMEADDFYPDMVAKAQLEKCVNEAKPVWQREAVEMVFERLMERNESIYPENNIIYKEWQSLKAEILDKIK